MAFYARAFVMFAAVVWTTAALGAAPEHVDIPDGALTLHAKLYRPEGSGPCPAVVALHDCVGLPHRLMTRAQRYDQWAQLLQARGFVVLLPDSFGSRGLHEQCRENDRKVHASRERVADANAARLWLQAQSYIKPDHISLLGWSNGGVAALWTIRPALAPHDGGADFRSAVALYPNCNRSSQTAWSARVPTLILVGSADESTPAATCQQMVADARGRSARVLLVVYPGAHHEFDRPNAPITARASVINAADASGRAHGGINPAARSDALKRVPEWLAK
jgi:dienelactone hydrolase